MALQQKVDQQNAMYAKSVQAEHAGVSPVNFLPPVQAPRVDREFAPYVET